MNISLLRALVTGCYSGYAKKMPGTAGTLAAAAFLWFLALVFRTDSTILALVLFLASVLFGTPALEYLLRRSVLSSDEDPQEVVIDEFAGYYLCMLFFPPDALHCTLGIIAFRLFDITKPGPIKALERLPGALGVMADDLLAGLFAALSLLAVLYAVSTFS